MSKRFFRKARLRAVLTAVAFVVLLAGVGGGAYYFGVSRSPAGLSAEDQESLRLYAEALDAVSDDFVDQEAVDPPEQTYAAIQGMLDSLGDEGHTRFLTPEEVEQNRQGLSGKYVGVGIQIENRDDRIVVSSPIEGSPADGAGVEPGDVLVAVNGEPVDGEELGRVAERIRGPEGTEVRLTFRSGDEEREITLERSEIEAPVVTWARVPDTDVAHVRLASFSDTSAEAFREALDEAREAGAERFVLDLRDNPGGRVDQAIQITGNFLEPGSTVYVRRSADDEREEITVPDDAEPTDAPLAVLVNGGSASSAEILAGALRDNDRAPVIGTTTFGTGTVLSEQTLSDGSAILLGVAEWLTPSGDFIRESGIEPGIRVPLEEDAGPLTPREARDLSREEISDRDPQLARALEELRE